MKRVFRNSEKPFGEIRHAAVTISAINNTQRHLGILHKRESDDCAKLHLAWHCDLRNDLPDSSDIWIDPPVPERRLRQVAAFSRRVFKKNGAGGITYAFSPPNGSLDPVTGAILLGPTCHGLTCASFVLAVFGSAGLHLVQYESWPVDRPGDADWQQKIINSMESCGKASPEHVAAVRSEIGAVRYRPEDVAGAATQPAPPISFQVAAEIAEEILASLYRRT